MDRSHMIAHILSLEITITRYTILLLIIIIITIIIKFFQDTSIAATWKEICRLPLDGCNLITHHDRIHDRFTNA